MGLIGLAGQVMMVIFFVKECGDLFSSSENYPAVDIGMNAKGYIAIGANAKGIISIGLLSQGLISISLLGYGLIFFLGQVGGGLCLGIYQVGVCWYCILGQMTISIWNTEKAQCGINVLAPLFNR